MEQPPSPPPPPPPPPPKPDSESDNKKPGDDHCDDPNEVAAAASDHEKESSEPPTRTGSGSKSVHWSPELVTDSRSSINNNNSVNSNYNSNTYHDENSSDRRNNLYVDGSNPNISFSPAPASSSFDFKETMGNVKDLLGRWGKKVGEAARKAEDLAGNTWQHRE